MQALRSVVRPRRQVARAFSSSAPPTFDIQSFGSSFERAYDDRDRFYRWDEDELFKPDMSFVKKAMSFALLHHAFPSSGLDLPDFIDGAQVALDLVLHTIYTPEFQAYVRDTSVTSPPVELLRSVMSPECFEALVTDYKRSPVRPNTTVALQQVDVHSGQFSRLLLDGQQMKLMLSVLYHTTEHLATTEAGAATTTEARDSYCQWTFATSIADPDKIEWELIDMFDDDV
ncbi:hypothetical protein SPRG_03783 [Saprolegnia parasitica CBS 223.65]|uniref:Tim44-like domain-containing protein n=1 Tax=Saprolegnia parasitica (strain CBS 223.65) TaxID=695850 RepID=A0A067CMY6_SAPPC|nr:hypothetical protein SPRG_03783 [Saprolegnia parasitica CBS 223.65]KDO31863.1 hypothetical protein SPRG_03783 [Saprolegnia parasitica CBS 223.65]|eukprot:XP_012197741.1 hypothetical protein SPRG_03783 [Saprolegnia parasitica CBS 223.65]